LTSVSHASFFAPEAFCEVCLRDVYPSIRRLKTPPKGTTA
jgi:hypothetical protein